PDPRGGEVRLPHGLQAFDVRDVVDPPGRHARARRPGTDDPPARPRRGAGAPPDACAPRARPEAEPRPDARGARPREWLPARARVRQLEARALRELRLVAPDLEHYLRT